MTEINNPPHQLILKVFRLHRDVGLTFVYYYYLNLFQCNQLVMVVEKKPVANAEQRSLKLTRSWLGKPLKCNKNIMSQQKYCSTGIKQVGLAGRQAGNLAGKGV